VYGIALLIAISAILLFKFIHDQVLKRDKIYLKRYTDMALFTGSFAIADF
jgi:hypothetical protein